MYDFDSFGDLVDGLGESLFYEFKFLRVGNSFVSGRAPKLNLNTIEKFVDEFFLFLLVKL